MASRLNPTTVDVCASRSLAAMWHYPLVENVVLWLIRLVGIATLIPSFFVLWYLAGADDQPRNVAAPILGFAVMITAVWTMISSFRTLDDDPLRVLWISTLPPILCLLAWPSSGTRAVGRDSFAGYVPAALWLAGPPLLTLVYLAVA